MKKTKITILLFFAISSLAAQNKVTIIDSIYYFNRYTFFEMSFGGTHLFTDDINDDLNWGFNGNIKLRFETKKKKVSFTPLVGTRTFQSSLEDDPSVNNILHVSKFGLQVDLRLFESKNKDLFMSSFFELNNSWVKNDFVWENQSFNIFKGHSPAIQLGYKLRYKIVFFEFGYDIFETKVKLNDELINEYREMQIAYIEEPKFSLNTLNLSLGISISFYQMKNFNSYPFGVF